MLSLRLARLGQIQELLLHEMQLETFARPAAALLAGVLTNFVIAQLDRAIQYTPWFQ